MELHPLLIAAKEKGIIMFDKEQNNIVYVYQNKKRNFNNPEEKIQALIFCKLVLEYGYSDKQIRQFETVKMGSSDKEADLVVYTDESCTQPYIIVECKKEDISELEFGEAVKQAFSYAYALAGTTKYIWVTKGNKEEFYKFDKDKSTQETISEIPYAGETDAKKYRYAKGGYYTDLVKGVSTKIKCSDIIAIEENDLVRVFKQAHDALWAGGELNPSQAFDELDKLVFCKVWDEKNTLKGYPYEFQVLNETPQQLKNRILALYQKGKVKDPEVFSKDIDLSAERIKTIVEYFQSISFLKTDLDSKGKAFETFLGTYFRGEFGQYFTPRPVVQFAVDVLPITNESKVIDTSCGSGGFLLYVLDKVRKKADTLFDTDNPTEAVEHYNYWHTFAEKNLFGIEINDQISRVAKMNMIIHDDGHTNVICFDGLYQIDYIATQTGNKGFAPDSFDFVVTNPPFGSIAKQSEKAYMKINEATASSYYDFALKEINWIDALEKAKHTITGRENQSTEILFIEQAHKFLKAGGYLAVVIPDGILTNSSSQYVRDRIEEKYRIVAVVSLPQTAFTATGAGVKSSVLFLKKHTPEKTFEIQQLKLEIQQRISEQKQIVTIIEQHERAKKEALKPLKAKDEATLQRRKEITDEYNEKINSFREELEELYQQTKQERLLDYPIFMAIAESIGYDATGKNTTQNDLPTITKELTKFIQAIEQGTDNSFFL